MDYNLSNIRNQVTDDKLDDTSFDSGVVDRFINATQREIFNSFELPFMEKIFSGSLPSDNYIFEFPPDLQVLQSAVISDPDGSQRDITKLMIPYKLFNQLYPTPILNEAGPIVAWTSYAGKMYTSRPIDLPYKMDVSYIKKPALLEDDLDVPEVPEEFQELLVLGAFKRVLQRNEDYDLAGVIGNEYNDNLDRLVSRYGFRITGQPVIMSQPNRRAPRRSR